jgi:hypothetical protein
MNHLHIDLPDLTIKEWLRAIGTSWSELRRFSKRRAAARKLASFARSGELREIA